MKTLSTTRWCLSFVFATMLAGCGGGSDPSLPAPTPVNAAQNVSGVTVPDAYTLELQAMQDVKRNTDVYVTAHPADSSIAPAGALKQLQLKSFDTSGTLQWTKNASDVPAPADASGASTATLTYTDMVRYQPVQAQVLLQTAQTVKTQVLKTSAPVKLRPDLTISNVQAPQQVQVGQIVNIAATVKELNGDLGATTRVSLQNSGSEIDDADAVKVAAGGMTQVVLAAKFDQPGQYTLTVGTQNTRPGDYDTSNDSKSFTIEVVAGVRPVNYYLQYYDWNGTWSSQWSSSYGSGQSSQTGEWEGVSELLWSADPTAQLTFPISKAMLRMTVDGGQSPFEQQLTLAQTRQWSSGCYSSSEGWTSDPNAGTNLYVQVVDNCGAPATYVRADQYAADGVVYSHSHDVYWGDFTYGPTAVKYGTVLHASKSVETRIVVTGANGVSIGGDAQTQVTPYPEVTSGSSSWYDGTDSWYYNYLWTAGWSTGITQP